MYRSIVGGLHYSTLTSQNIMHSFSEVFQFIHSQIE